MKSLEGVEKLIIQLLIDNQEVEKDRNSEMPYS